MFEFQVAPQVSEILTRMFTADKNDLKKYCVLSYARNGVNQMWILLKRSKELLENVKDQVLSEVGSIKIFLYLTHYTTYYMTDQNLNKLKETVSTGLSHKNGNRLYKCVLFLNIWTHTSIRITLVILQLVPLKCWNFVSTISMWSKVDIFFSQ